MLHSTETGNKYPSMNGASGKQIREFYAQWFGAMEEGDIDRFLGLLDKNFYLKSPGQPPTTNREKLREGLEQFHSTYSETVEWKIEDLKVFDDYAVVRIAESVTLVDRQSSEPTRLEGVHLAVMKKNADGDWRLATDVSSFNHPVPVR